jgi:NitT/TauT family transport system ATP-binding protein
MGGELATVAVSGVCKSFSLPDNTVRNVLRDVSLELDGKRFTSLIGPNGCGKSTLLGVIAGITPADSGLVKCSNLKNNQPRVGYVWQDYRASLLPWVSAAENVAFPLRLHGQNKEGRISAAGEMMREFMPGVDPQKPCYQLSGGQQQMLCLLRSAIAHPDVLLFDEPFSALDQNRRWAMTTYVERIWQATRAPALFVSHDVDEAVLLADDILLMNGDGRIEKVIENSLPRPRPQTLLTDSEHIKCRDKVIAFLLDQESASDIGNTEL